MEKAIARVLLIIEDAEDAGSFRGIFADNDRFSFLVEWVSTFQEALGKLTRSGSDLIVIDITMPDAERIDAFLKLKEIAPSVPVLVLGTAQQRTLYENKLTELGAQDFFVRTRIDPDRFLRSARSAMELYQVRRELLGREKERKVIFDSTRTMIWYKDKHNRILKVNRAVTDALGLSAEEIEGKHARELFPEEADKYYQDELEVIRTQKLKTGVIELLQVGPGKKRWVLSDKLPYSDEKGELLGVLVFSTDITIQKLVEDQLEYRVQFEKLVTNVATRFINMSPDKIEGGIYRALEDIGKFIRADRGYVFMFSGEERRSDHVYEWSAPGVDYHISRLKGMLQEYYPWLVHRIKDMGTVYVPRLYELTPEAPREKEEFHLQGIQSIVCVPLIFESKVIGFLGFEWVRSAKPWSENILGFLRIAAEIFVNALEHKRTQEKLNHLVYHDSLTDLPNRELFLDRLNQAMVRAKRGHHRVGVIHVDFDQFKRVNDMLGHEVGDKLLREAALRIREVLNETDTATRIGGDEFNILLPLLQQADDVYDVVNKIFSVMQTPFMINNHELHMTCSIGSAVYPGDADDAEGLLRNADAARHHAKEQGRNTYKRYDSVMSAKTVEHLALENRLRHAIQNGELKLYYQPQVEVRTGEIVGVEALVRWQHPESGLIMPAEFIPLAEETDLIIPLGRWVLQTACAQIKEWLSEGIKPVRIAVNLSPQQFQNENIVETVSTTLGQAELDPRYLELELTESTIMKNIDEKAKLLRELKKIGVRIAIDDFGAGQSSLGYLKRLPLDTLKIDRSFVRDLPDDPDDAAIAKAIISIASSLKLEVIAEGVETAAQLDFLRDNRCYRIQGYLFSKPLPAGACRELLMQGGLSPWHRESVA